MKRFGIAVLAVVFALSSVSLALSAELRKGTIRGIDTKAGTITFCPEGTQEEHIFPVEKSVDISKLKTGEKVEITIEKTDGKEVVKGVKSTPARRRIEGC